jgi:hypothetical protein
MVLAPAFGRCCCSSGATQYWLIATHLTENNENSSGEEELGDEGKKELDDRGEQIENGDNEQQIENNRDHPLG